MFNWQGVNYKVDAALIKDNELQSAINFYVSNSGRLVARNGFERVATLPSAVVDVIKFQGDLYAACNDSKFYKSDGTLIGQLDSSNIDSTVAFGKVWIADGGKLKYYDGTNFGIIDDLLYYTEKIADGDGATTSFTYTTQNIPVSPNSVTIYYTISGTDYTANDDGEGNITGEQLTGTVNYTTGDISLTFSTAPDNGTPINVKYSCSSVLDVQADFIEFRQERLWLAKGDTLYYSDIRDPSRWSFIKVGSMDESDVSGISQIYDMLVIFKEGAHRGIYALSGNSEQDFVVSLIARGVSATNNNITAVLGDLYFIDGGQMYSLRTVMEYGSVKPISINSNFIIADEQYHLAVLPVQNVIFAFAISSGFAFNVVRKAFTMLAPAVNVYCLKSIGNEMYLGGENGIFKYANTNKDDINSVPYVIKTKILSLQGLRRLLIKRFSFIGVGIDDADINVVVFKRDTAYQLGSFSFETLAKWDGASWDVDTWSNSSLFNRPVRQLIGGDYIYFSLQTTERFILDGILLEVA